MPEMKIYKCRCKEVFEDWASVEGLDAESATETYAAEYGLDDGAIVSVKGAGKFLVTLELDFCARKISGSAPRCERDPESTIARKAQ